MSEKITFTVLGVNDDRDTCDCCGKTNLKRVVWLQDDLGGEPVAYGTSCAAAALSIEGRWTARDADRLVCVARERADKRAKLEAKKTEAQARANQLREPVHVLWESRDRYYYTLPESALVAMFARFPRYPRFTAQPAA